MIMTLDEFYKKTENITKTNPAPEGMCFPESYFFYRKIINEWRSELSTTDKLFSLTDFF